MAKQTTNFIVRLDKTIHEALVLESKENFQSLNGLINKILSDYTKKDKKKSAKN